MSREVVILGMGAVSCAGADVEELWASLLEGRSGIRPLHGYDTDGFAAQVAGLVRAPFDRYSPPFRNSRLMSAAVSQAVNDCGRQGDGGVFRNPVESVPPDRRGLYTSIRPEEDDESSGSYFPEFPIQVARDLHFHGPSLSLHDACATGTSLLGEAFRDLREGRADLAMVAASNADITAETLCHYALLGALSRGTGPDACRPFDRDRDGFVRAEGAACLILRTVPPGEQTEYIRVLGYGASADAHRLTAGHPEERGMVLAMERCLQDAGVSPDQVDHLNAHGTGTVLNDLHEARAIHRVFGGRADSIPLTANKAVTGHASFASGLLEAVAAVRTLQEGIIPPTAHLQTIDPELPSLDIVRETPRPAAVRNVMSLSAAFGGMNAVVFLGRS